MNTLPKAIVKKTKYPGGQEAMKITGSFELHGKPCELNSCWMRLGTGKNPSAVLWTRRLAAGGDYKKGCVDESLGKDNLPKTKEGENIYCQIMFEPKYVYDKKAKKITKVDERMIGLSKIIAVYHKNSRDKKGV